MRRIRIICAGVALMVGTGVALAPTANALPIVGTVSVCVTVLTPPPTCVVVP